MSAFNTLRASVAYPVCGRTGLFAVQFKFGDAWQHEYTLGDTILWGGNDYGRKTEGVAQVEGIGGPCSNCAADDLPFVIAVSNNQIESVGPQLSSTEE